MLEKFTADLTGVGKRKDMPLTATTFVEKDGRIMEGLLTAPDGHWYPVVDGVPCFLTGPMAPDISAFAARHGLKTPESDESSGSSEEQEKTCSTFSDKWNRFRDYGLEAGHGDFLFDWYVKKFGLKDQSELKRFYGNFERALEVGPGSGFNTRFIATHCPGEVHALDISDAANTTFGNTKDLDNCMVVRADLMHAPYPDGHFDCIVADGVLHHTPNTRKAVRALYRKLAPGGSFFFYVYKKMGPARLFCDEFIRDRFKKLEPEECYKACEGLTELGRELSRLGARIRLEKGIEALGVPPGEHDVQRLLYYNFLKCFWNDAFDWETNNMVNFDWYHPESAWQHDEEEVESWLDELGVAEFSFNPANPNGISCLLIKPE